MKIKRPHNEPENDVVVLFKFQIILSRCIKLPHHRFFIPVIRPLQNWDWGEPIPLYVVKCSIWVYKLSNLDNFDTNSKDKHGNLSSRHCHIPSLRVGDG